MTNQTPAAGHVIIIDRTGENTPTLVDHVFPGTADGISSACQEITRQQAYDAENLQLGRSYRIAALTEPITDAEGALQTAWHWIDEQDVIAVAQRVPRHHATCGCSEWRDCGACRVEIYQIRDILAAFTALKAALPPGGTP